LPSDLKENKLCFDMKLNLILAVLVVTLAYVTCRNLRKETPIVETPIEEGATSYGGYPSSHGIYSSNPDSAPPIQNATPPRRVHVPIENLPPASASRKAYLNTGWWHLTMAYQPNDSTIHHQYQPKWIKFHEDQTFDVLIGGKVVERGKWGWDDPKNEIYLSCQDPYINNTWSIQDKGFVMIWKGNTAINLTGTQVRVVSNKTPPPVTN